MFGDGDKKAKVIEAINGLAADNAANWTEDGRPDATVLSDLLDFKVTAKLRDECWVEIQAARAAAAPAPAESNALTGEAGSEEAPATDGADSPAPEQDDSSLVDYEVLSPLLMDGVRYEIGDPITLTYGQMKRLPPDTVKPIA